MKKSIVTILCFALITVLLLGCSKESGKVIATSGDSKVTLSQFMYFLNSTKLNTEEQMISGGYTQEQVTEYWKQSEDGKTMEQMLKEYSLDNAKEVSTLFKLATEAGFKEDDALKKTSSEDVDKAIASLAQNGKKGTDVFQSLYGITVDEMKVIDLELSVIDQYTKSISDSIEVTDDEALAYYNENKDTVDQVTVRHILVKADSTMSEDDQKAAKVKADDLLKQVNEGADIGKLAAEFSEDPGSKDNNGEYTFGKGMMVPEFEEFAFTANIGDKGVVKTDYGYHVMQLINKTSFDDSKEDIKELLKQEETSTIITDKITQANMQWTLDQKEFDAVKVVK